jgi:hypothetical protein
LQNGGVDMWTNIQILLLDNTYFEPSIKVIWSPNQTQQIQSRERDEWGWEGVGRNVIKMQVFVTGFSFIS